MATTTTRSPGWSLRRVSETVEAKLAEGFVRLTFRIAHRPARTAWVCTAVALILATGWLNFSDEDDPQKFLVPQDSRALRDRDFVEDRFDDAPSPSQVFLNRRGDGANILTKEALREVFALHETLERVDARNTDGYDARTCAVTYWRPPGDEPCQKESILALWDYNVSKFEADADILATVNRAAQTPDCCAPSSRRVDITSVIAKIGRDDTNAIVSAGALRLAYFLDQDRHDKERTDPVVVRLENKFDAEARRQHLPSFERPMPLTPAGAAANIDSAFLWDRLIVTVAFFSITGYAYAVLKDRRNPRKSRGSLGLQAVAVVGLAVAAGFGICFAAGIWATPLVTVAAFLVLGVGIDDAFVIIGAATDAKVDGTAHWDADAAAILSGAATVEDVAARRACVALAMAGPSITTTSITDAAAFLAGSWTRIPAISNFCMFAAACVACDWLLQVTLFVALFVWDLRKKLRAHVRALERAVAPADDGVESTTPDDDDDALEGGVVETSKPGQDDAAPAEPTTVDAMLAHVMATLQTTREEPGATTTSPKETAATLADVQDHAPTPRTSSSTLFGGRYAKALLSPPGLAFVLAATATTVAVAAVGCARYDMNFDYHVFYVRGPLIENPWIPRTDQFQRKWFPGLGAGEDSSASYGIYTKRADYFAGRDEMRSMISAMQRQDYVVGNSLLTNWFTAHEAWLADQATEQPTSNDEYVASVRTFLETPDGASYVSRVVFRSEHEIAATQVDVFFDQDSNIRDSIDAMRDARRTVKKAAPSLRPVVYGATFPWLEGLAIIEAETVRALAIACSVVVVVLVLLLGDVAIAALISGFVCCIALCTFGSIYWYGDELNFISAFFIVISVGLATDASAHVAHAYIHAPSSLVTGPQRATHALEVLGASVFRGGLSTLVGVMIVGAAKTYVFLTFFWYLTTIMVLSLWFGLAVTPAALAVLGPYLISTPPAAATTDLELAETSSHVAAMGFEEEEEAVQKAEEDKASEDTDEEAEG